jgi:hypothetical protein
LGFAGVIFLNRYEKRKHFAENVKKTKAQQKADARKKAKEEKKKTPKAE